VSLSNRVNPVFFMMHREQDRWEKLCDVACAAQLRLLNGWIHFFRLLNTGFNAFCEGSCFCKTLEKEMESFHQTPRRETSASIARDLLIVRSQGKGKVMFKLLGVLSCFIFVAWGCANIDPPAPGPRHPANSEAQSALLHPSYDTLDVDEHNLPGPPREMQSGSRMHHPRESDPGHEKEDQP